MTLHYLMEVFQMAIWTPFGKMYRYKQKSGGYAATAH